MKKRVIDIIVAFFVVVPFLRCSSSASTTRNKNSSYIYSGDPTVLHPQIKIFNSSSDSSIVYFRITSKELLFSRIFNDSVFNAALKVQYYITQGKNSTYKDSATLHFTQSTLNKSEKWLVGHFDVATPQKAIYYLSLKFTDVHRNHYFTKYLEINKKNQGNRQNYLVLNNKGNVLFKNYLNDSDTVMVIISHPLNKIFVRYYPNDFPPALPPFVDNGLQQFNMNMAQTTVINLNEKDSFRFYASREGIYHLQIDTSQKEGLSFFNFGNYFPHVKTVSQMCNSLRYLTSQKEYNDLTQPTGKKQKQALDNFWLKVGGTYDRAKKVINQYYRRVEESNQYFTSYQEGWKTDRGLIYIVYGQPDIIYRNNYGEKWVYGQINNNFSKEFIFRKVPNPFTNNDYALVRSINYKNDWFRSVQLWRDGRIFN